MPAVVASFVCGMIFGAGLLISGMTEPEKVLGFLDILGAWDATLAFVMAGAVAVAAIGFAIARRRTAPVLSTKFLWPDRRDIDAPLVAGAVLFGIGWGLVGICPGPALVNLACRSSCSSSRCCSAWSAMNFGAGVLPCPMRSRLPRFHLVQTGEP
jgi:uncharacterized membrane protein YedE/YeeE